MSQHPSGSASRLQLLYELNALRSRTSEERLEKALELITRALRLDVGIIGHSAGDTYTFTHVYAPNSKHRQGETLPLRETYSSLTLQRGQVLSIDHMRDLPEPRPALYWVFGYESYIGAALTVQGAFYGVLAFAGSSPRTPPFSTKDEELVTTLARWTEAVLESQIAELLRRESDLRFRSAFHDAAVGMAILAPDGHFLEVNRSFCIMLGYSVGELLAMSFQQLTHPDDLERSQRLFSRACTGELESYGLEKRYLHKDGHTVWVQRTVTAVRQENGELKYLLSQVQDITLRKHYEARIEFMAYRDELTGIYNRRHFFEYAPSRLELARQAGLPVALIYLDLNGFKQVNDTLGHQAGDDLLRQIAQGFENIIRQDDLIARLSGDEFVLLLFDITEAEVARAIERLIESVKHPFSHTTGAAPSGVSIGVVIVSRGEASLETLLAQADRAMYCAKERKALEPYAVEVVELGSATEYTGP